MMASDRHGLMSAIRMDLSRYSGGHTAWKWWRVFRQSPGFRFTVSLRLCRHFSQTGAPFRLWCCSIWHRRMQVKYGFQIPFACDIGGGLYLPHWGGIVVNSAVVIGEYATVLHGVTIGKTLRGDDRGAPELGNRVWIGPNAVLVGRVRIGDEVLVAPGAFINRDIPNQAVVVGNPGKIVSSEGSQGYTRIEETSP